MEVRRKSEERIARRFTKSYFERYERYERYDYDTQG